jgi:hypothetical protein
MKRAIAHGWLFYINLLFFTRFVTPIQGNRLEIRTDLKLNRMRTLIEVSHLTIRRQCQT